MGRQPQTVDLAMSIEQTVNELVAACRPIAITRLNVERLLDTYRLECAMRNGNWWRIRRNGQTIRWATDATRIRIPFKFGLRGYGCFTEAHFDPVTGALDPTHFRVPPPPERYKPEIYK